VLVVLLDPLDHQVLLVLLELVEQLDLLVRLVPLVTQELEVA